MFNMPSIPLGTCPVPQRLLSQFLNASHQALAMQSVTSDLCQEGPGNDSPKSQAMGGCKSQISTASPLPVLLFFFLFLDTHQPPDSTVKAALLSLGPSHHQLGLFSGIATILSLLNACPRLA